MNTLTSKISWFILACSLVVQELNGQGNVGIGTTNPHQSSLLELKSENKGFLLPRMTTVERLAIDNPTDALLIYDLDVQCFFFYKNNAWANLCNAVGMQGLIGFTGNTGFTGLIGFTGVNGTNGINGATGLIGATGLQGVIGVTGIKGATGNVGVMGVQGLSGFTGFTGLVGVTGASGTNGATGLVGATGLRGMIGATGTQGATGSAGAIGMRGLIGFTGATGFMGLMGVTGASGTNGATGLVGATGLQGLIGVTGIKGATGSAGAIGMRGLIGFTGATGFMGLMGVTGTSGTNGATGLVGATGLQGMIGTTGIQGTTGNVGVTGLQGLLGITGATGLHGFTGITGETGIIGITGATGVGIVGITGASGVDGLNGVVGVTGETGMNGITGATGPVGCAVANYLLKSTGTAATCTAAPLFDSAGQLGVGTVVLNADYLISVLADELVSKRNGISMIMQNQTATSYAYSVYANNPFSRGIFYTNSFYSFSSTTFFGVGSALSNTNKVGGYLGYRTSGNNSYGLYGVNGSTTAYETNPQTWALFSQGRAVISAESAPSSPVGVDLEIRNTTTGAGNPATLSMRQSLTNSNRGSVLSSLNFGDNRTTNPQAQIRIIRDEDSGNATDLPTAILFSTTKDGTASLSEAMRINNKGKVGIGTMNYDAQLSVENEDNDVTACFTSHGFKNTIALQRAQGTKDLPVALNDACGVISRISSMGYDGTAFRQAARIDVFTDSTAGVNNMPGRITFWTTAGKSTVPLERMRIDRNGNVLMGNDLSISLNSPTELTARLTVLNPVSSTGSVSGKYFEKDETALLDYNTNRPVAIYAQGDIVSTAAVAGVVSLAFSDARIKKIAGVSNSQTDLAVLQKIKVTDYTYIDTVRLGSDTVKKVIAQELETVYPRAVKQRTDFVPNIFAMTTRVERNLNEAKLYFPKANSLKAGSVLKVFTKTLELELSIKEVGYDYISTEQLFDDETVFVYGTEVSDFRTVDYDALGILNISATQELSKQLAQQQSEIEVLKSLLNELLNKK